MGDQTAYEPPTSKHPEAQRTLAYKAHTHATKEALLKTRARAVAPGKVDLGKTRQDREVNKGET